MKILVLDNYDSFTYNLVSLIQHQEGKHEISIVRNNEISIEDIDQFQNILISPGPGLPSEAGILPSLLKTYAASKNIFGVCLGHQAIAERFGGSLSNLEHVFHGISSEISLIDQDDIFKGIPPRFQAGRYHSWVVNKEDLPGELKITALDEHGSIMAMKHRTLNIRSVQFHPESIMSEFGFEMMRNWISGSST